MEFPDAVRLGGGKKYEAKFLDQSLVMLYRAIHERNGEKGSICTGVQEWTLTDSPALLKDD